MVVGEDVTVVVGIGDLGGATDDGLHIILDCDTVVVVTIEVADEVARVLRDGCETGIKVAEGEFSRVEFSD